MYEIFVNDLTIAIFLQLNNKYKVKNWGNFNKCFQESFVLAWAVLSAHSYSSISVAGHVVKSWLSMNTNTL